MRVVGGFKEGKFQPAPGWEYNPKTKTMKEIRPTGNNNAIVTHATDLGLCYNPFNSGRVGSRRMAP